MTETPPYLRPFVLQVDDHEPERTGSLDLYRPAGTRVPAILFVHGGPGGPDLKALPRDWPVYRGYGAATAARGLVGATVEHPLIRGLDQLAAASDEVEAAVGRLRADPQVDPNRIALWFFSGAGLLAGEWLDSQPEWLRGVALTYPRLSAPAGTVRLTSAIEVIGKQLELPVLLTRAGLEREDLAEAIAEFVATAEAGGTLLDIIDVPKGRHGFDMLDHTDESRDAVTRALDWMVGRLIAAEPEQPVTAPPRGKPQPLRRPQPEADPAPVIADTVADSGAAGVVSRHLAAFGAQDLNAFLGTFAPNAQVYRRDGTVVSGRRALREHYSPMFETGRGRVEVLSRIAEGEWVVDHQIVHGIEAGPLRVIAVHRVHGDAIAQVHHLV
jgi:dienelactone hydrolase